MTTVQVHKPNLTDEEIRYAIRKLSREPNEVEWAMLEAQWSEHCSYKSSKPLLRLLPSKGPRVIVGPGSDAGVIDVGNEWVVTLHIESHNHPSAIDPYGGAATGVGGVVRDILSLGTRPVALLDPLRFGALASSHSRWLFDNVVRGIGSYGNCIGVPTVGGEVEFDTSFERNCLVDVVCVGLGRRDNLVLDGRSRPGDLVYVVGGSTGRDGMLRIRHQNHLVAEAPAKFVAEAPLSPRSSRKPSYVDELADAPEPAIPEDLNATLLALLGCPNICSREWIYRQYDFEVGLRTIIRPGQADSATLRLPNSRTLAITTDGNSKQAYLDPYWGTVGILSEAFSNLVATGAEPIAVVDHLQYGNPGNPEVYWTFREAIRAIRDYLKATRVPCVGGKVSFYNEDTQTTTAIKPSPVIAAVGLRNARAPKIGPTLAKEGDDLLIVGTTFPELGGSEYFESVQGLVGGRVPKVNLRTERQLLRTVTKIIESGGVEAAHDISKGGLTVSLAEMAIQGQKGFTVNLDKIPTKTRNIAQLLFSESKPRFVLESRPKNTPRIMRRLAAARIKAAKIGRVQGSKIQLESDEDSIITIPLSVAADAWSKTLSKTMDSAT